MGTFVLLTYDSPSLSAVLPFAILVTHSQPWFETIKWKFSEIIHVFKVSCCSE
jgi:hypothetical protein